MSRLKGVTYKDFWGVVRFQYVEKDKYKGKKFNKSREMERRRKQHG